MSRTFGFLGWFSWQCYFLLSPLPAIGWYWCLGQGENRSHIWEIASLEDLLVGDADTCGKAMAKCGWKSPFLLSHSSNLWHLSFIYPSGLVWAHWRILSEEESWPELDFGQTSYLWGQIGGKNLETERCVETTAMVQGKEAVNWQQAGMGWWSGGDIGWSLRSGKQETRCPTGWFGEDGRRGLVRDVEVGKSWT